MRASRPTLASVSAGSSESGQICAASSTFQRGEVGNQVVELEDKADVGAAVRDKLPFVCMADIAPVNGDGTRGRGIHAAQDVERRGLACARSAQDNGKLAALDGKACAVKRMNLGLTRAVSLMTLENSIYAMKVPYLIGCFHYRRPAGLVPTSIPPSVNDTRYDFARREDGTEAGSAAFAFILGCG